MTIAEHISGNYTGNERRIGNFYVNSVTNAPLQIEVAAEVNLPQDKAFRLVFENIDHWAKEISNINWYNGESSIKGMDAGAASTRICGFGNKKLHETIVFYDPPNAYGYTVNFDKSTASMPVKDHFGAFIVEASSVSRSVITWRQYFNKKFNPMALMITPMMKNMIMKANLKRGLVKKYGGQML